MIKKLAYTDNMINVCFIFTISFSFLFCSWLKSSKSFILCQVFFYIFFIFFITFNYLILLMFLTNYWLLLSFCLLSKRQRRRLDCYRHYLVMAPFRLPNIFRRHLRQFRWLLYITTVYDALFRGRMWYPIIFVHKQ